VPRWNHADDDPPVTIGADPNRPTADSGRSGTPGGQVLDVFIQSWRDAASRYPAKNFPRLPYLGVQGKHGRISCSAWIKHPEGLLAECNGDLEYASAVVQHFVEGVTSGQKWNYDPEAATWPVWVHLKTRLPSVKKSLAQTGWLPQHERTVRDEAHKAAASAESERRSIEDELIRKAKLSWLDAMEGKISAVDTENSSMPGEEYDWTEDAQTEDYLDWVDVPFGEGVHSKESFLKRLRRKARRPPTRP
jgi:hypothetical protein